MNLKKKLLGLVLTSMIVISSGITAFAAVPDGSWIIKNPQLSKDIAVSNHYLKSEHGKDFDKKIKNMLRTSESKYIYIKNNGKISNVKTGKILNNKDLRQVEYFDMSQISNLNNGDYIINNKVYNNHLYNSIMKNDILAQFLTTKNFKNDIDKAMANGITGDYVAYVSNLCITVDKLVDNANPRAVKRTDYPLIMDYYYRTSYEAGDGDIIK